MGTTAKVTLSWQLGAPTPSSSQSVRESRVAKTPLRVQDDYAPAFAAVAWMHDLIEDEGVTAEQLRDLGIDYAQGKAIAPNEPFDVWFEGAVMRSA